MTYNKDDIIRFIQVFNSPSNEILFSEVACYWFAHILADRFFGDIVYDPSQVHFATMIDDSIYDIKGEVDHPDDYVLWDLYVGDDRDLIQYNCIKLRGGEMSGS